MNSKIDLGKYPKIIKIEDNGDIVALDKRGRVNTEFNINNINNDKAYNTFGTSFDKLHDDYINENLSRYEKNKQSYRDQDQTERVKPYDERYDLNNDNLYVPKKKNKSKKWFSIIIGLIAIVVIIFLVISYITNKDEEKRQQEQQTATNQQLQQDMKDTQSKLADSQTDKQQTQQEINNLQNRVDNLKNNQQENTDQGAINSYQDGIDKLQDAQNSKAAGNYEEVKDKVKGLDKYIDTEKITDKGKSQWNKFKIWLESNNPF